MDRLLFVIYATAWDYMEPSVDGKLRNNRSDPKRCEDNLLCYTFQMG